MALGLLGKKIGMTRVYNEQGKAVPVTVIEAGPCTVVQIKNKDGEGYEALQLGFGTKRDSLLKKPEYYHYEGHGVEPCRHLVEFRVDDASSYTSGQVLTAEMFQPSAKVDIVGTTKGRGFAGVMKRWGFHGARASHGAHKNHRRPGAVGNASDPSRIFKNKKMPGHMGNVRQTVKNLEIVSVDTEKNLICVKGPVPGHRGSLLRIIPKGEASNG